MYPKQPRQSRGLDVERIHPSLRFGLTRRPRAVMRWRAPACSLPFAHANACAARLHRL